MKFKRSTRSGSVRAVMLGGAAFGLVACEEQADLTYFDDAAQCERYAGADAGFSAADCADAFAAALEQHGIAAPRYESLELCEQEHGAEACASREEQIAALNLSEEEVPVASEGAETQASGGHGSFFMPLLAGYMMGNVLGQGARTYGQPLYPGARGSGLFTSGGRSMGAVAPGVTRSVAASSLAAPRTPPPVMTRASVASRGGFGAARATGGLRGFGG